MGIVITYLQLWSYEIKKWKIQEVLLFLKVKDKSSLDPGKGMSS